MKFKQVLREFRIDEADAYGQAGVFGIEFKSNPMQIIGVMSKTSTQGLRSIEASGKDPVSFTENLEKAVSKAGYTLSNESKNLIRKKLKKYMPKVSATKGISISNKKVDFVVSFKGLARGQSGTDKEIEMTEMTTSMKNKYNAKGKGKFKVAFPDEVEEPQQT
jgi:hypothetical protein